VLRPGPQENLPEVVRRAFEAIEGLGADEVARRAGGDAEGGTVRLPLLGKTVVLDLDRREVRERSGARADDRVAAVAARYSALAGRLREGEAPDVAFADWPDARGYLGPFRGRVLAPLLARFGRDPAGFARAADALGGVRMTGLGAAGSVAYELRLLPRLRLALVLDPGDEELPPGGQVLFPPSVFEAMTVEDAVALAELASRALRGRLWGD
jgi:hypothetical protein